MSERLPSNEQKDDIQSLSSGSPDWSIVVDLANNYTLENTREYIQDRFHENLEMFERLGDAHMAELYKSLMDEYPSLRTVELRDEDIDDNANFGRASLSGGSYIPKIAVNFSHKETYIVDKTRELERQLPYGDDRLGSKYFIKRLAFAVGADWKKCAKNLNLMADATFLHEFGHAHDFIENFLKPQYESISGGSRGAEALYRASEIDRANRKEYELQSPDGSFRYLHRHSKEWKKSGWRLRAMGIENYDEYLYARHQYYRDQPDEAYADKFAYDFIMRHYDDYFTSDPRQYNKVYVNSEREIKLDRDFVHILGLKQGLGVEINRLNSERKSVKHITGFLALNMYVGKSVYLYEHGDPKNPGEKWRICRGISEMTLKPVVDKNTGKINHYVFFKDEDGNEYHISRTNKEPEAVACSPDEMAEDLGLKAGDKVQLIKHLSDDARTMDFDEIGKIGQRIIEGVVSRISGDHKKENVLINTCSATLNYPAVRKWKRYYVGDYEILPLPEDTK